MAVVEAEQGWERGRGGGGAGDKEDWRGGARKKKGEEVRLVWQRVVVWASNSGHRARMTSNRSRALCQHSQHPQ